MALRFASTPTQPSSSFHNNTPSPPIFPRSLTSPTKYQSDIPKPPTTKELIYTNSTRTSSALSNSPQAHPIGPRFKHHIPERLTFVVGLQHAALKNILSQPNYRGMFLCLGDPVTIPWELLDAYSFKLVDILTSIPGHGLHPLPRRSPAWKVPFRSGMLRCFFFAALTQQQIAGTLYRFATKLAVMFLSINTLALYSKCGLIVLNAWSLHAPNSLYTSRATPSMPTWSPHMRPNKSRLPGLFTRRSLLSH